MEIKTTLKNLFDMFVGYAAEDAPPFIKRFAAQLAILTAHVNGVAGRLKKEEEARQLLDSNIAELATIVMSMRGNAPAPTASAAAPAGAQENAPVDEDDAAKAMVEEVQQATQAEMDAIANQPKPADITPLRKNGSKPAAAGEVA